MVYLESLSERTTRKLPCHQHGSKNSLRFTMVERGVYCIRVTLLVVHCKALKTIFSPSVDVIVFTSFHIRILKDFELV